MEKIEREGLKCPKCGHEWKSSSKLLHVTCPSCQRKFPKPKKDVQKKHSEGKTEEE